MAGIVDGDDRPRSRPGRKVHPAASVAEFRVAAAVVDAALRLCQPVRDAAQFGTEFAAGTHHLADLPNVEKHVLPRRRPVDEAALHPRTVIAPARQVLLADRLARKTARHRVGAGGKACLRLDLAAGKAAGGQKHGTREYKVMVVVGEAEHRAVAPPHPPAMAGGRRLAGKMRGQRFRNRPHGNISTSGMEGMRPASKCARLTSIRSMSKRTGTSNS